MRIGTPVYFTISKTLSCLIMGVPKIRRVFATLAIITFILLCANFKQMKIISSYVMQTELSLDITLQEKPLVTRNDVKIHNPRIFSDNIQLNIDRGLNIIHMLSAQYISAWIYDGSAPINENQKTRSSDPKVRERCQVYFSIHSKVALIIDIDLSRTFVLYT